MTLTTPSNGSVTGPTPTFAGQAGTAAGDEASVTIKVYAGATVTGSPVQTLTATPNGAGAYTTNASPLADGTYTAQAEQRDTANNTGTSSPTTFSVDTTAPDTSIDSSPPLLDNSPAATFTFLASEPGSTFACQLDGGGFSACTSPKSYSGLTDGSHTFQVRATDPAGNTDPTPATFTWTIDTSTPDTSIDSSPPLLDNSATATFTFLASEPGSTFACQLDGGGFSACTSPKSYSGLTDGSHTFRVRATSSGGSTDPTPATFTWTIDTSTPDTSIDSSPPLLDNSATATFTFLASEPGSTFACQLDGGGFSACTSPKSYSGLTDGSHTFQVRATDPAGNTDPTPATFTWTIDSSTPQTTINSGPADPSSNATATFTFSAGEPSSTFACQLDGGGFSACTSPKSYSGLTDGSHTFQVRATDPAGNTDPTPATFTWTIDTTPPAVTLTHAEQRKRRRADADLRRAGRHRRRGRGKRHDQGVRGRHRHRQPRPDSHRHTQRRRRLHHQRQPARRRHLHRPSRATRHRQQHRHQQPHHLQRVERATAHVHVSERCALGRADGVLAAG